jgi:phosphonate transport system substrate-binding protein
MNVIRWLAPRLVIAAAVSGLFAACGLNQLAQKPLGSADRPIKMATVPFLETGRLTKGMKDIGDFIEKETGLKVQSDVPTSYVAVVEAVCADKLDVAWVSPLAYILAHQKCNADMQLASINSAGKTTYHGLIIARTASDIKDLNDLKGKRFAWVDPTSTSGYLYPRALLAQKGINPDKDLGQQVAAGSHDKVVIAVMNNQVDAGAIYDDARTVKGVTDQFPKVAEETRVVGQTEEIPNDGVAFRKGMPADLTTKVKDALLKLSSTDEGKKVFRDAIGTSGVAATTDSAYDPVRRAAQVLNLNLEEELKKAK